MSPEGTPGGSHTMRCPTCDVEVPSDAPNRPFCSARCKWVDLGHWLDGDYVIPGESVADFDVVVPPPPDGEEPS